MSETGVFKPSESCSGDWVSSRRVSELSLSEARLVLVNFLLFAGLKDVPSTASGSASMMST
jgi:hypothetical protein